MKIKSLQRHHFDNTSHTQELRKAKFRSDLNTIKDSVNKKLSKDSLYINFLYFLSIVSISCWIISLRMLPFGDMFQFILGTIVLSVNLLVFKYTKI